MHTHKSRGLRHTHTHTHTHSMHACMHTISQKLRRWWKHYTWVCMHIGTHTHARTKFFWRPQRLRSRHYFVRPHAVSVNILLVYVHTWGLIAVQHLVYKYIYTFLVKSQDLCACLRVYVLAISDTYMHTYVTHTYMHIHTCTRTSHIHTCTYIPAHVRHTYIHAHTYTHTCVTHTYMHIHTCTRTSPEGMKDLLSSCFKEPTHTSHYIEIYESLKLLFWHAFCPGLWSTGDVLFFSP